MKIPTINDDLRHLNRKEWANQNQHICVLPYSSRQFFHSSLSASPCCNLIKKPESNFIKPIIEIKDSMMSQQTYNNCSVCYACEDEGKISERTRYLIELSDQSLDSFIENQEVGEFYVHCTLSNLCNMACRSCNINTSSLFAKIELGRNHVSETISDSQSYWDFMLETIRLATQEHPRVNVVVSGGEGFVQSDFEKLYNWLIDNNLSQKINFTINTNGTVSTESLFDKLCKNFKQVSLAISIDSIYENYHYVRWPYTWEKISRNLETFVAIRKVYNNFNFFLTPVWSVNNIFYLKDWIEFFDQFSQTHSIELMAYDTPLFQPTWLDTQYMPEYLKKILINELEPILDNEWFQKNKTFHANVANLIELYKTKEYDKTIWNNYLKRTADWDIKTNTSIDQHNIKLYKHLNDQDIVEFTSYKKLVAGNRNRT
jgi:organic radical activating enzyme